MNKSESTNLNRVKLNKEIITIDNKNSSTVAIFIILAVTATNDYLKEK